MSKDFKRDYLTSGESLDLAMIISLGDMLAITTAEWNKRGMITTENAKGLKTAQTYIKKFVKSTVDSLNQKESQRVKKKYQNNVVRMYDKFSLDQLQLKTANALKTVTLDREEFDSLSEHIMDNNCKNCLKNWQDCELHNLFYDNLQAEPSGEKHINCRYSYTVKK